MENHGLEGLWASSTQHQTLPTGENDSGSSQSVCGQPAHQRKAVRKTKQNKTKHVLMLF
jgi:hypothetical protein